MLHFRLEPGLFVAGAPHVLGFFYYISHASRRSALGRFFCPWRGGALVSHRFRTPRPRGSAHYDKEALSPDALLARLSVRGLQIPDSERAGRYLRHVGYYRFSPYTIPFQQGTPDHKFRSGVEFDDVLDLYVFDRGLRLLVIDALERVEVAVRAALTDHMSSKYANPHWYMEAAHFRDQRTYAGFLSIVEGTVRTQLSGEPELTGRSSGVSGVTEVETRSLIHRSALEHYLTTYGTPELPPSWLMTESLTIGQLSNVISNLKLRADKTAVAKSLGLNAPVLESWLRTYVRVRNTCAHHARLWNVGLGVYPMTPTSPEISWLKGPDALSDRSQKRLYPVLVSLQSVLDTVSPRSSWAKRLHEFIDARPPMNLAGMGIPVDWAEDEFWSRHLA